MWWPPNQRLFQAESPSLLEEAGAEDLGGVVGARGLDDQVDRAEQPGHEGRLGQAAGRLRAAAGLVGQAVAGRQAHAAGRARASWTAPKAAAPATIQPITPSTQK